MTGAGPRPHPKIQGKASPGRARHPIEEPNSPPAGSVERIGRV
jgi:hypothetical protein